MLMSTLRLIVKDKGGKQHCLIFVGSNLEVDIFFKKREYQKRMRWNRGLRHLCSKACLLFTFFFLGCEKNSKSSIFFHSLIIEFLWFFWLRLEFEEKIHTKVIVKVSKKEHPLLSLESALDSFCDSLRWVMGCF